jgi:hypothetical protein
MKLCSLATILLPVLSCGQALTGNAHTSGSCSPAITGNSNQITVTCTGLSKEKADDMVRLMNSIMARQLDPKKVYAQLDEIYGAVNNINNTITSAIDPLANAPSDVAARVKRLDHLQADCFALMQPDPTTLNLQDAAAAKDDLINGRTGPGSSYAKMMATMNGSNNAKIADYKQNLAPKLVAARDELLQLMPDKPKRDYSAASPPQLVAICSDFAQLTTAYKSQVAEELRDTQKRSRDKK